MRKPHRWLKGRLAPPPAELAEKQKPPGGAADVVEIAQQVKLVAGERHHIVTLSRICRPTRPPSFIPARV